MTFPGFAVGGAPVGSRSVGGGPFPTGSTTTAVWLPEPYGMTFNDWAARVTEQYAAYGVPEPFNESRWKDWACSLLYVNALVAQNVPSPLGFTRWQEWAAGFVESVR